MQQLDYTALRFDEQGPFELRIQISPAMWREKMGTPFIQPRFTGARFDSHTLPLDIAKDLWAYQDLIAELARRLYKSHYKKDRVPPSFGEDFSLSIAKIDDGCAKPLLVTATGGTLALGEGSNVFFEQARDLISECIAAPAQNTPKGFPVDLLSAFRSVGKSLLEGEEMELPRNANTPAILTQSKRNELIQAGISVSFKFMEISGSVQSLKTIEQDKPAIDLRQPEGGTITVPIHESDTEKIRECCWRPRHLVKCSGQGGYNSHGKLTQINKPPSIEIVKDYQICDRLNELKVLESGWYHGSGKPLNARKLKTISESLSGHFPHDIDYPSIFPTPEGNLRLEWEWKAYPSLEIELENLVGTFHAMPTANEKDDIEQQFDLSGRETWTEFYSILRKLEPKK